ncbi:hypothetical protein C4157_05925 [Clostridioides difficile]|nr:hypothetical protein DDG61_11350 [Clostridioides difficile]AWH81488.1 hypothetical protein DDG63_10930 [Clostridioides difficile]EGT2200462.1 hypothetical protein [Clostridioides difficile]EGT2216299.1 hypothetical protein [Clostridioides difficile]EGT3892311.1 hypothetical protein [Clostridioides difficile]
MLIPLLKYIISTNGIKIIYNKVKIIPISTILFNILQLIFFFIQIYHLIHSYL